MAGHMEIQAESTPINQELTFYNPSGTPLTVQVLNLTLTNQGETGRRCCLTCRVSYELYENIIKTELFNLKPDAKIYTSQREFLPELNVDLELELQPDLLTNLSEDSQDTEATLHHLLNLGVTSDADQALNWANNWYCLSVKQQQGGEEVGYRTLWDYMNLAAIARAVSAGNQIAESLSNFFQASTDSLLSKFKSENHPEIQSTPFNLMQFLQTLNDEAGTSPPPPVSQVLRDFFNEDGWEFVRVDEEDEIFQVKFEGENGLWNCYACANDPAEQLVFYSICPLGTPVEQLLPMAEFLSKVNYGLTIGNFELDFKDGEVRYKTSIDVENDRLTVALVENLVYMNVQTMDKYLPGITGLINNQISPEEALNRIELAGET